MKTIYNKILNKISRRNSTSFVKFLKNNGCTIGDFTHFHDPKTIFIDIGKLKFIEIGKYVQITRNVTILAHDFSYSILKKVYNDLPQKCGVTKIGDNVFIGMNSIILMGSKIGSNVIIGAGSVVSGIIPDNCVVAGNPARIICSLDEYYKKCLKNFDRNLYDMCIYYYNKYHSYPTKQELSFFNLIYMTDEEKKNNLNLFFYPSIEEKEIENYIFNYKPKYDSLESFLKEYSKKIEYYEGKNEKK